MYFSTFLIYAIFMCLSVLLAFISQYSKRKIDKIFFLLIAYFVIVLFWSIRYDIGFDYENYIYIYYEIKNGYSSYVEPVYAFLSKLFSVEGGEYLTISAMSFLTYFFLFYMFIKKNVLWLGVFFSLAFQFQFMAANQVRQALAISVFLCLLHSIEKKRSLTWIIGIIIVALICHTSALFLLVMIPFCRINLSGKKWCIIISVLFLLYLKGAFRNLGNVLITSLPLPDNYQHFLLSDRVESESVGFSMVMLFYVLVALYIAWNYNMKEDRIFSLYMLGTCMYIVFIEYHLFLRLSFYLFYTNIYIASMFCKENRRLGKILLVVSFLFYLFVCAQPTNMHGVIPYKTLLIK